MVIYFALRDVAQLGRALRSGRKGRRFESCHPDHVGANVISFAPTYFISQSALILLLLLSKSQPLRWVAIWFRRVAAFLFFHF